MLDDFHNSWKEKQTDRQTDRQTDNKQTNKQTNNIKTSRTNENKYIQVKSNKKRNTKIFGFGEVFVVYV